MAGGGSLLAQLLAGFAAFSRFVASLKSACSLRNSVFQSRSQLQPLPRLRHVQLVVVFAYLKLKLSFLLGQ